MAINPLQLPGPLVVPKIDFTGLDKLGDAIGEYRQRSALADAIPGLVGGNSLGTLGQPQAPQAAPTPPAAPTATGLSQDQMALLKQKADQYGIDPNYLIKTASIEGTTKNPASSATGLGQFIDSTAKQYGVARGDDASAADGLARFTVDNQAALTKALGRPPTSGELYLAHQQGAQGAINLLSHPDAPAIAIAGPKAVMDNGGSPQMTAAQFAAKWTAPFGQPGSTATAFAGEPSQAPMPAAAGPQPPQQVAVGVPASAPSAPSGPQGAAPGAVQPMAGGMNTAMVERLQAMIRAGGPAQQMALALIQKYAAPQYGFQTLPDGTVVRTNQTSGTVEPIFESGKPEFTKVRSGIMGDEYGFVDKNRRTINGQPISQGAPQTGMIPNGPDGQPLQGPALMAQLEKTDPAVAAAVKGVLAGDINAGSRNLQKLLPIAALVEPGFTQQDYTTRLTTARGFASGAEAKQVKAANQAITHAEYADSLIDKLGNSSIMPGIVNPIAQGFKNNIGDADFQSAKAQYNDAIEALAGELTKTFRGGPGAQADIEHWRQSGGVADSPVAMHAHIQAGMKLLNGGLEALSDQYNRGMRSNKEPIELLSPRNQGAFSRLMGGGAAAPAAAPDGSPAPSAPKQTSLPSFATPQDAYAAMRSGKLKSGDQFMTPDGQTRIAK